MHVYALCIRMCVAAAPCRHVDVKLGAERGPNLLDTDRDSERSQGDRVETPSAHSFHYVRIHLLINALLLTRPLPYGT